MTLTDRLSLREKVAIVTGAGHGIGKVIAAELAKAGAKVAVLDISEELGRASVRELLDQGLQAEFVTTDLRDPSSITNGVKQVVSRFKHIDIVVNNARPKLTISPFSESLKEWDEGMAVLLKAPALLTSSCMPFFPKMGGCVINMVSVAAQFVSHQPAVYHVAKAGLVQLTRVLAVELASRNIRVNAVCPGLVDLFDENKPLTSNELHRRTAEIVVPLKRAGTPQEIADCVIFLCSPAAAYITGQVLGCDGGETLQDHFHVVRQALISKSEGEK